MYQRKLCTFFGKTHNSWLELTSMFRKGGKLWLWLASWNKWFLGYFVLLFKIIWFNLKSFIFRPMPTNWFLYTEYSDQILFAESQFAETKVRRITIRRITVRRIPQFAEWYSLSNATICRRFNLPKFQKNLLAYILCIAYSFNLIMIFYNKKLIRNEGNPNGIFIRMKHRKLFSFFYFINWEFI